MKKMIFVTGNKGKIATARQYFSDINIELETYHYDLIEPRADDVREIAESKVRQAYKKVHKPCIAQDSGFFIEALNGFPRTFVNFALQTLGLDGILKLMEKNQNRRCEFRECLAYFDGGKVEYFLCTHKGVLSEEVRGFEQKEKWSDLWYVFVPEYSEDGKTLAEYSEKEHVERRKKAESTFRIFAEWYKQNQGA